MHDTHNYEAVRVFACTYFLVCIFLECIFEDLSIFWVDSIFLTSTVSTYLIRAWVLLWDFFEGVGCLRRRRWNHHEYNSLQLAHIIWNCTHASECTSWQYSSNTAQRMITLCAMHCGIDQLDFWFARDSHTQRSANYREGSEKSQEEVRIGSRSGSREFLEKFLSTHAKKSKFASRCKNRFSNFTFLRVCECH